MGVALLGLFAWPLTAALSLGGAGADWEWWRLAWPTLFVAALTLWVAVRAPSARVAWGRLFVLAGAAALALPFHALALSSIAGSHLLATNGGGGRESAAVAAGVGIAAVATIGAAAVFGFFAGAILLIAGLMTLRRPARGS